MEKKVIEEVIIKRNKSLVNKEKVSEKIKNEMLNRKKRKEQGDSYLSAQKIVKDYREKQKSYANFKRKVHNTKHVNNLYEESKEGSTVIVIRISGNANRISKEINTILVKLKLKKMYSAILMKYDRETFRMLTLIEPYVTWGFVNKKQISDLITKRGSFHNENGTAVQLENEVIENSLGKFNILCLEDIIHELSSNGQHFSDAMNFLGFFLLSPTEEVKEKINIPFFRGGSQGFRGDKINDLLKKMI